MTNFSAIGNPADSLSLLQYQQSVEQIPNTASSADGLSNEETIAAARSFEALLIHNMLKAMRRTTLAENTSNERAIYDDMLDQHLAKVMSDSGGFGLATTIARQLEQSGARPHKSVNTATLQLGNQTGTANSGAVTGIQSVITPATGHLPNNSSTNTIDLNQQLDWANRLWIGTDKLSAGSPPPLQQQFVHRLLPGATVSAQRLGTTPEAVLAVAALESGWGEHVIHDQTGGNTYNLFGIKAQHANIPSTTHPTSEYIDGQRVSVNANFRRYKNEASAIADFANFILENPRYSAALEYSADPAMFLRELQNAGYATDPEYADKAIAILRQIESYTGNPTTSRRITSAGPS